MHVTFVLSWLRCAKHLEWYYNILKSSILSSFLRCQVCVHTSFFCKLNACWILVSSMISFVTSASGQTACGSSKASRWLYVGLCCVLQDFQSEPFVPVRSARPEHSDRALLQLCEEVKQRTEGKGLDLLIAILPDNNGPLYGMSVSGVWFWCRCRTVLPISNDWPTLLCRWSEKAVWDKYWSSLTMLLDQACV